MSLALASRKAALLVPWLRNPLWAAARAVPSLDLRFADSKSLTDAVSGQNLITYTRASGATSTDSQGVIRNAVTNLLLRSEEFGDAYWTKFATTVSINTSSSPTGSATADSIVESATTAQHGLQAVSAFTPITTTAYTGSVYAKASERTLINVYWSNGFNGLEIGAYFNLSSGLAYSASAGVTASIASSGNGWYRCSISAVSGASPGLTNFGVRLVSSGTALSYTGDGTSGIFLWGAQLEQSATVGEYIPTTTTINSAPRFDHNPTTGESLGLLIEEQRTNLLLRSEEFDNASWSKNNTSITANTVAAPNGTASADSLIENSASTEHSCTQTFTAVSGTAYTLSVFVKSLSGNRAVKLRFTTTAWTGSINTQVDFNLTTGAGTIITGSPTFTSQAFPGGWWRFSMTATSTANGTPGVSIHLIESVGSAISYTGDNASGIYLWGAQLEAGAFATSYIPTTGTAATRSADVASITGSAFSGFYRQDQGTVFWDGSFNTIATNTPAVTIFDSAGASSNRHSKRVNNTTISSGGSTVANFFQVPTLSARTRFAYGYAVDNFCQAMNSIALTDTAGAVPVGVNTMEIGKVEGFQIYTNGPIRRLTYWPQRLGNEVLQRITQ